MPGPLGSPNNNPLIDDGTMMLQAAPLPGPAGSLATLAPPLLSALASGAATAAASSAAASAATAGSPTPASSTTFHPGISHGHTPAGRWSDVQASPNSSMDLNLLCKVMSPRGLVDTAIIAKFGDKPIALAHLRYYLAGSGVDFNEDKNIDLWLRRDKGIQSTLASHIPATKLSGTFADSFKVEQSDYDDQDFRFAFGAIDILDFEVDFSAGTIHVWFQDFYEWHPVYPFYTALAGDVARDTNCVHAALVELKSSGAADFWMKGEATIPLSVVVASKSGGGSSDL